MASCARCGCKLPLFSSEQYCEKCLLEQQREEERKRKTDVEAILRRIAEKDCQAAEDERQRKVAEEERQFRAAEEERERQLKVASFKAFSPYTTVDIAQFIDAGYKCEYDEMAFTAHINKNESLYRQSDDHSSTSIEHDIIMMWVSNHCILTPRIIVKNRAFKNVYGTTTDIVYFKIGENRYTLNTNSQLLSVDSYHRELVNVGPVLSDTAKQMICDMTSGLYEVKIRSGKNNTVILPESYLEELKCFYELCESSGVFAQERAITTDDFHILTQLNRNANEWDKMKTIQ